MALPTKLTLDALQRKLAVRIGHGAAAGSSAAGSAAGSEIRCEHLRMAQSELLADFKDVLLETHDESITTFTNVKYYTFPDDCDPMEIIEMSVRVQGYWIPMHRGIATGQRHDDHSGIPSHWDIIYTGSTAQIELWPIPSPSYNIRIDYQRRPTALEGDMDTASVDEDLLLLYATSTLKSHYRQPDAEQVGARLDRLLANMRAKQHGTQRLFMEPQRQRMPFTREVQRGVVVGIAGNQSGGSLPAVLGAVSGDGFGMVFGDGSGVVF